MEVRNPLDREKSNSNIARHLSRDTSPPEGACRQDKTASETFATLRRYWLKHYDAMEVLIMDQGTEIQCRISTTVSVW